MATTADLLEAFEVHSPEKIRAVIASGVSAVEPIDGKAPIYHLVEMYLRSTRFTACFAAMKDGGATLDNPLLDALLMDDAAALRRLLSGGTGIHETLSPLTAFTSCRGATPLHICAEYNSLHCARLLIAAGADVNARAAVTEGIGGHTPIFHTVNTIFNFSRPMMELLVEAGADLHLRIPAILWGESMDWETVIYDVTPISYAQCGLYRQFHRDERDIFSNIEYLQRARDGVVIPARNVPNKYVGAG